MEKGNGAAHTLERVAELAGVSRSTVPELSTTTPM